MLVQSNLHSKKLLCIQYKWIIVLWKMHKHMEICVWVSRGGVGGKGKAGEMRASRYVIGQPRGLFQARCVVQLRSWGG